MARSLQKNGKEKNFASTFNSNLGSIATILAILTLFFGAYKYLENSYASKEELQQALKDKNLRRKEYVVIPGNAIWVNSQIRVKPGQTVKISASGSVNLAMHRSVQAAINDVRPSLGWCDAEGIQVLPANKPLYKRRKQLLIDPTQSYGCLLMFPWLEGNTPPSIKMNQSPPGMKYIGKQFTFTHSENSKVEAVLYFTCNDTFLNPNGEHQDGYVGTQAEINETYPFNKYTVDTLKAWWDRLYSNEYWNVWFDDNAGAFFIEVEYLD